MIHIKAQVATEYLVVIGLALLLVVPLTFLYFKYSTESSYSVTTSKIDAISNEIINAANQVNVYGAETQIKLSVDFPEGIQNITFQNREITFIIIAKGGQYVEIPKIADVNFSSLVYTSLMQGKHDIIIKSLGNSLVNVQIK
ncbi:MAG: hypothetical protein AABX45_00820 [Nanoarchaeota archaeon]